MGRESKTTSKQWEVNPDSGKWQHVSGQHKWRSKRDGEKDLDKIAPWIEDMEEWSEMMYEAVLELREQQAALRQEFTELSDLVKSGNPPGR
jgi:hypothetical protein